MLREYFIGVFSLGIFIAVALGVSHLKLKGSVTFGAGILLISAILLPLVDIIKDNSIDNMLNNMMHEIEYEGKTDDVIELAFEEGVAEYIAEKYSVSGECVSVNADGFSLEKLKAQRIYVNLSIKAATVDYKRIEREIAEEFTLGGECEVSICIG